MDPLDDTLPEPLPVRRILRRAANIAARPVVVRWMLAHIVLLSALVVVSEMVFDRHSWPRGSLIAWGLGWLAVLVIFGGSTSGGVAAAAWAEHVGERATIAACVRAVRARARHVAWESSWIMGVVLLGLLCLGVGAVWALAATCAIIPSCVCERGVSAKVAAQRGLRMIHRNETRAFVMFALVTPVVVATHRSGDRAHVRVSRGPPPKSPRWRREDRSWVRYAATNR
jgi:hypothetical protein